MNRLWVMLVAGVLGTAMPGGTAAAADRTGAQSVSELILLFFADVSRGLVPKRVVAEDKDWKIVKEAEQHQEARKSQEERRREAYKRLEEQEREARRARDEYRRESRNLMLAGQGGWHWPADERGREARRAQEERVRSAEQRMHERDREAQKARRDYQHLARLAREERRREAEKPRIGG